MMTFDTFVSTFLMWTEEKIEAKKDDGYPICPFARKARIQDKIQFIDARDFSEYSLSEFNKEKYEIGIAWMGDKVDVQALEDLAKQMEELNPDLFYFTSTVGSGHFTSNFTNCIFIQLKDDILSKREYLKKSDYYSSWPEEYYKLITGHDFSSL